MKDGKLQVAVVGLRFGGCFPPIYGEHPDVAEVAVCDSDEAVLNAYGDKYGIAKRTTRIDVLAFPSPTAYSLRPCLEEHP